MIEDINEEDAKITNKWEDFGQKWARGNEIHQTTKIFKVIGKLQK